MNQGVAGRKFARSGENTRPPKWPRLDSKLAPYPVPRGFCFVCFSGFTNWKKMLILDLLCNFGKRFSSPHGFGSIRKANFRNFTMQRRIALISLSVQFKKGKKSNEPHTRHFALAFLPEGDICLLLFIKSL